MSRPVSSAESCAEHAALQSLLSEPELLASTPRLWSPKGYVQLNVTSCANAGGANNAKANATRDSFMVGFAPGEPEKNRRALKRWVTRGGRNRVTGKVIHLATPSCQIPPMGQVLHVSATAKS